MSLSTHSSSVTLHVSNVPPGAEVPSKSLAQSLRIAERRISFSDVKAEEEKLRKERAVHKIRNKRVSSSFRTRRLMEDWEEEQARERQGPLYSHASVHANEEDDGEFRKQLAEAYNRIPALESTKLPRGPSRHRRWGGCR